MVDGRIDGVTGDDEADRHQMRAARPGDRGQPANPGSRGETGENLLRCGKKTNSSAEGVTCGGIPKECPGEPAARLHEDAPPTNLLEFPAGSPPDPIEQALAELDLVYAFIYNRVGNRPDAEDLTQQVALKALPRLRHGAPASSIRGYLFATARSVLATFWAARLGSGEQELHEGMIGNLRLSSPSDPESDEALGLAEQILAALPENYRRVLELRFLRGYSIKEVAAEIRATPGSVKVMQLRALRAAARLALHV